MESPVPLVSVRAAISSAWVAIRRRPHIVLAVIPVALGASLVVNALIEWLSTLVPMIPALSITITALIAAHIYVSAVITRFLLRLTSNQTIPTVVSVLSIHGLGRLAGVIVLTQLVVVAGLIAGIVPGIVLAMVYSFAPYIALERGFGPIAALKESATLTRGVWVHLVGAGIILSVVALSGIVALGVGLLVSLPLAALAHVYLYRQLSERNDTLPRTRDQGRGTNVVLAFACLVILVAGVWAYMHTPFTQPVAFKRASVFALSDDLRTTLAALASGAQLQANALVAGGAVGPLPYRSQNGVSFVLPSGMQVVSERTIAIRADGFVWERIVLADAAGRSENPRMMIELYPQYWAFANDHAILDFSFTGERFVFLERLDRSVGAESSNTISIVAPLIAPQGTMVVFGWYENSLQNPSPVSPESLLRGLIESVRFDQ
jgi:uncharacterized membrane protein